MAKRKLWPNHKKIFIRLTVYYYRWQRENGRFFGVDVAIILLCSPVIGNEFVLRKLSSLTAPLASVRPALRKGPRDRYRL